MTAPPAFRCRVRHPLTGAQIRIRAGSPRELEALRHHIDSLKNELRLGLRSPEDVDNQLRRVVHGAVGFVYAARIYAQHRSSNTGRCVHALLLHADPELTVPLEQLSADRVGRWLDRLRKTLGESTRALYWRVLRAVVRYAIERGWIGSSPWGSWRPVGLSTKPKRLREAARSPEEIAQLLTAARAIDVERREAGRLGDLEAKIAMGVLLGLRQGELAGLRWSDLDAASSRIAIVRQYAGGPLKGRTPGLLAAVPELFALLAEHAIALREKGLFASRGPVFPSPRNSRPGAVRPYARGQCLTTLDLRSVVSRAGLPSVEFWSPHSLRDSFATREAIEHGGDLASIAQRTRHASIASLVRYLRSRTRGLVAPAPPTKWIWSDVVPPALGPIK
jgi:integrase